MKTNLQGTPTRKQNSLTVVRLLLIWLVLFAGLSVSEVIAQTTVTIPSSNTNGTSNRKPLGSYYGFERTHALYTSGEIGTTGTITAIRFYVNSRNNPSNTPIVVRMRTNTSTTVGSTTFATAISGATTVFSGTITSGSIVAGQWVTITLTTPFNYTSGSLHVMVETNTGGTGNEGSLAKQFRWSSPSSTRCQTWQSDWIAPTGSGSTSSSRPNIQLVIAPFCSGTPSPGSTISSSSSVCSGGDFDLSFQNTIPGSGVTYQWQSSPNGSTWTNITGANDDTYSTSHTTATYYRCRVTCGSNTGNSSALLVGVTSFLNCYCASNSNNNIDTRIQNVTLGTLNNSSPNTCQSYTNYTNVTAPNLQQGSDYNASVRQGTCGSSYSSYIEMYIDYNQNGVFEDPAERVLNGSSAGNNSVVSGNITIPMSATPGVTGMRVVLREGGTATTTTPCGTYNWGETEDYRVNIILNPPCSGTPSPGSTYTTLAAVCSGQNFTLSFQNSISGTGVSYQWQSSANGSTWSNISGATGVTHTTNQNAATYYRLRAICSGGGTGYSSSLLINQTICYCIPPLAGGCAAYGEAITNVNFAGINNNSGCASSGYTDYSLVVPCAQVTQGTSVPISITYANAQYNENVYVWIDYNDNGVLTDPGELVFSGVILAGAPVLTGNIEIPGCAPVGTHRMRVRMEYNTTTNPCVAVGAGNLGGGEAEDYCVTVNAAPTIPPIATNISGPNNGSCNEANTFSVGAGYSGTIQWQYATSIGGPYSDIVGANQVNQQLTANGPSTFYLRIRFTGSGCVTDVYSGVHTLVIGPQVVTISTSSTSTNVCRGQTVVLTASGSGPFLWNTGATTQSITVNPIVNSTYSVNAGSGLCTGSASTSLTVIGGPIANASFSTTGTTCPGAPKQLLANLHPGLDNVVTVNGGSININSNGNASPYPSNINVSGLTGTYTVASVTINNIQHNRANHVDMVLRSPSGQSIILMADVGGSTAFSTAKTITLKDGAPAMTTSNFPSGTYRPTNLGAWSGASLAPYTTTLSTFTGNLNGTWRLYVFDDTSLNGGSIQSWSITFDGPPTPFNYDGPLTYSWTGTNGFTSNDPNPIDFPQSTTTYTLTVADNSCSSSSHVGATVFPAPSVFSFNSGPYCENSDIQFYTYGTGVFGPAQTGTLDVQITGEGFMDEVSWQIRNSSNAVIASGGNYAFGSENSVIVSPSTSDYPVTFHISTVGVENDNDVDFAIECSLGGTVLESGTVLGGNSYVTGALACNTQASSLGYVWNGPNSFTSTQESPLIPYATYANSGLYSVTVIDANGCQASFDDYVVVNENPVIDYVSVMDETCQGAGDGMIEIGISGGDYNYAITDGAMLFSFGSPAYFFGVTPGVYNFYVSDGNTCFTTTSTTVGTVANEPPAISCIADIMLGNDPGECGAVVLFTEPDGIDDCPGATTVQTAGLPSGSLFPIGTTTNTFVVTDALGLTSTCSFEVTVNDTESPIITCNSDIVVSNDAGQCGAMVSYGVNFTDNCSGAGTVQTAGLASGAFFPIGTTINTFVVTDASGNTATCSFTVTVNDTENPIIICNSDIVASNDAGQCGAVVSYILNFADNCSGAGVVQTAGLASGAFFPIGTTINTFVITDASGNTATCSFTVTVNDTELPVIICNNDIVVSNDGGQCGAVVSYSVNFTDNCSGAGVVQTAGLASGAFFPIGTTTNTFVVTDASGNTATCSFNVTVNDTELPVITCNSDINIPNDPGICGAVINYTVTSIDNCTGQLITQTNGLPSGSLFPVGTTINSFLVTDAYGNTASCSFSITVTDNESPSISNVPNSFSSCNPISWVAPIITDNCPGVQITSTHIPGTVFASGTTTVTYTATDAYGHQSTASFDVTVLEPSLAANSISSNRDYNNICRGESITLSVHGGFLGEQAAWKWYTGSCGGTLLPAFNGQASITVTPLSTTTYFARAEGLCNTTACVEITVVVSVNGPLATPTYTYLPDYGAPGITDIIQVAPVPGATYYYWFTNNGQINSVLFNGQVSPQQTAIPEVAVTFALSQQNYHIRVRAGNACGISGQANSLIRGTVAAPTSLTGPTQVCPGQSHSYTVSAIPSQSGNTQVSYNWELIPSTAGTISGSGLTRTVTFAAGFTSAQLCVNGISSFGLHGAAYCITITTNSPTPGIITGPTTPCTGSVGSYSISSVPNATSYVWSSNIPGAIVSGNGINASVSYPANAFSGTICVVAVSACGTSSPSCITVSSGVAGIPGPISGPALGICGASSVNYSLATSNANSYNWILPTGATFASSNGSNSVNLNFGAGFSSGTITVEAYYDCGSATSDIYVSGVPFTPTLNSTTLCAGTTELYFANSTGATSFNWIISGDDFSYCTNPPTCSQYYIEWGSQGGSYSVSANNACGTSAPFNLSTNCRMSESGSLETKVYPNPTNGTVTVEFNSYAGGKYDLHVTDITGRIIISEELLTISGVNKHEVDLGFANTGIYILYLKDVKGKISVTKVTVE